MADRAVPAFGTVVVVGGGCYGSWYVRQLQRAARAGAVRIDELVVVDHDPACRVALEPDPADSVLRPRLVTMEWEPFFADYLGRAASSPADAAHDTIVPSPLMPHLLYDWVAARMRARWPGRDIRTVPVAAPLPVPWQRDGTDGTRYASFATWMCPINCIEPARCPHTRGARDWSMPVALERHVAGSRVADTGGAGLEGPYVFHCTHRAYGVGMIDVATVLAAEAELARRAAATPVEAIIGTVSHCHGAVARLHVGNFPT